jgi:anti-sigma B factor antagonist
MSPCKELRIEQIDDVTVIQFREAWIHGLPEIEVLGEELYHLVETENRTKLLMDFSDVEFLSSSALGKIIRLYGKVKARNGCMSLCNLRPQILEVFLVCKLDRLFNISRDRTEALTTF